MDVLQISKDIIFQFLNVEYNLLDNEYSFQILLNNGKILNHNNNIYFKCHQLDDDALNRLLLEQHKKIYYRYGNEPIFG